MDKASRFFQDVRSSIYSLRHKYNCTNQDIEIYVSKDFWKILKHRTQTMGIAKADDSVCSLYGCNIFVVSNKISKHNIWNYKITLRLN